MMPNIIRNDRPLLAAQSGMIFPSTKNARCVLLVVLALLAPITFSSRCIAQPKAISQQGSAATDLHFLDGIIATKASDPRLYVLLGSGFLRPISAGDPKAFISGWLSSHPNAIVTPISRMLITNRISHRQDEIIYIWIEDGASSLNVDLIRAGIFVGDTMFDMVDNEKGLDELLKRSPELADARAEIAAERAATPQDRTARLVPERGYKARMRRIASAEREARAKKRGVWSNAMREEREAEGAR